MIARRLAALFALCCLAGCAAASLAPLPLGTRPELRFLPDGPPKAVVLALHGFNDRKAAFAAFGPFLAANGVALVAYDQQGFGANQNRGRWPGDDVLIDEAAERIRALAARYPGVPVTVLGESLGAAVAVLALTRYPGLPALDLLLVAPGVWGGDAMSPFYRLTLGLAAQVAPGWTLTGEGLGRWPSDNVPMLRELGQDPLMVRATRIDAIAGAVRLMTAARAAGPTLALPTFVMIGDNDEIVPIEAQTSFVRRLTMPTCFTQTYSAGWHMLLRDLQRERVWQDVLRWLDGKRPPSPDATPCTGSAGLG